MRNRYQFKMKVYILEVSLEDEDLGSFRLVRGIFLTKDDAEDAFNGAFSTDYPNPYKFRKAKGFKGYWEIDEPLPGIQSGTIQRMRIGQSYGDGSILQAVVNAVKKEKKGLSDSLFTASLFKGLGGGS